MWGNSEGNKGNFNTYQSHQWHCDRVGEYDLQYTRIKVMIYLTPTTKEEGALRVMPGSHKAPLHQAMIPLNAQGEHTSETVFGMPGNDLPGYALESQPGDAVFFNHYLFHAVYGKSSDRRYMALKFADLPREEAHYESLARHHQGASCLHQAFVDSDHPRVRHMVSPLLEGVS